MIFKLNPLFTSGKYLRNDPNYTKNQTFSIGTDQDCSIESLKTNVKMYDKNYYRSKLELQKLLKFEH